MPISRMRCRKCDHEFEFMKVKSDDVAECPKCASRGEGALERLFPNKVSHSLKGGGWYKDGYNKKRGKK